MAYKYLRHQVEEYLIGIIRERSHDRGNNLEGLCLEDFYHILKGYSVPGGFYLVVNTVIKPVLRVYGMKIIVEEMNNSPKYWDNITIERYSMIFRDYYDKIVGDALLSIKFSVCYYGGNILTDIDIYDRVLCEMPMNLLLDPLAFFQKGKITCSGEFITGLINRNVSYYTKVFWIIGCVCELYLVSDMTFGVRIMVMDMLKLNISPKIEAPVVRVTYKLA